MTTSSDPNKGGEADSHPTDRVKLVHEARKAIKRMRALARLLRYELGEEEFGRVNDSLRRAGQRLAGARDADVRLATLERLRRRHPRALALQGIEGLRERLEREREQTNEPTSQQATLKDIAGMRRELAHWNLVEHDLQALGPGLKRLYGEGRSRYVQVKREHANNAEHIHDWRKRVKSLYYTLDMLGGESAKGMRKATQRAKRLGDLLGEEHDLWMLCAYVEQHPDAFGDDISAHKKLLKLIQRRRKRLHKRMLEHGKRLYRRKPGNFTRRTRNSLGH
ncbi:MAG: CHAD domain-containing protein [Solirubrobacteraceae bacterium]